MKRLGKSMWLAVLLAGALATVFSPRAAAQNGSIAGTILDVNGKPWFGLNVEAVSEQGAKQDAKTDLLFLVEDSRAHRSRDEHQADQRGRGSAEEAEKIVPGFEDRAGHS